MRQRRLAIGTPSSSGPRSKHGPRMRGRVRLYFPAGHHTEDLARDRGYRLWRSSYTMNIDLGDEPPEQTAPSERDHVSPVPS